ncbi:MAG: efflux RND transporter permease subunit [Limnochordaceae bacterium]|nr:efflux RND transporter permease subunit [Limnochordaceae bacterium]
MNLAKLAVRRPVLVLMMVLAVVVFSALAVPRLGMDLLPNLELPVLAVVTVYPRADPEAVEQRVGVPVEGVARTVSNVDEVHTITWENVALTIATFRWGTNLDSASQELSDRLRLLRLQLPEEAQDPMILKLDPAQLPLMVLGVGGNGTPQQLVAAVNRAVKPLLEQTPGVARVVVSGAPTRQVLVRYRPDELQRYQISPSLLTQAVQYQNMTVPIGTIRKDGKEYPARVGAGFHTLDDLRSLVVGRRPPPAANHADGVGGGLGALGFLVPQFVTLGDVATVEDTYTPAPGYTRVKGRPAILLSITKESGVNTMVAARAVHQTLTRLQAEVPQLQITPVLDQSQFIQLSIDSVAQSAWVGGLLAVLILLVFLGDWLSPLIIGISIPFSILVTGVAMYFGGLTLNLMSLGGLALGIGMLVDNSIVVLESIFRHLQTGEDRVTAAVRGTGEVAMAVTASTLTTLAVFLPVVFIGGLAGEIFRELSLTVSFALAASLLVALTVVPLLAARFLSPQAATPERSRRVGWFSHFQAWYGRQLDWALGHKLAIVVVVLVLVGATAVAFSQAPVELLPPIDLGEFSVDITMPVGTPPETTNQLASEVEQLLLRQPEVKVTSLQVGARSGSDVISQLSGTAGNQANIMVELKPRSQRTRSTAQILRAIRPLATKMAERYQARLNLSDQAALAGAASDFLGRQVTVEILGQDQTRMVQVAQRVQKALATIPGLVDVQSSLEQVRPLLDVTVDRTRALLGGLTAAQVGLGVREALLGTSAGTMRLDGEDVPIVVQADVPQPTLDAVAGLKVGGLALPGSPATLSRVGAVSQVREETAPTSIERLDGQRIVTVKATPANGDIGTATTQVQQALDRLSLPPGVSVRLGGVSQIMQDSFADLRLALVLAVILVYMVMAAEFESLKDPLIIILTVPLAAVGAFWAIFASGNSISIISLVGMVILTGVVVNNGIVLVDYANQLVQQGMPVREAARTAGRVRLRPVLMTAITTILGLIPMAVSRGEAAELDRPLAISVMGGLALATFLTLVVVPVAWEWFQRGRTQTAASGSPLTPPPPLSPASTPGLTPSGER